MRATQLPKARPAITAGPAFAGDDMRDIAREILHPDAFERARAPAGATRLRPQHAIASLCAGTRRRRNPRSRGRADGSMTISGPRPSAMRSISTLS